MKQLILLLNLILTKHKALKKWQRIVTAMAAVVTFVTTYALILPAITVEKDNTEEVSGMYLEAAAEMDYMSDDYTDAGDDLLYTGTAETVPDVFPRVLTMTGPDYTVTVTCDEASCVPAEASLDVHEIVQGTDEYDIYLNAAKSAMGLTDEENLPKCNARFFDIKIMAGGEEFVPETSVAVKVVYEEPLADIPQTEVNAVHFADETAAAEVLDAEQTEILYDGTSAVDFTAESFSVYGIVYTVDFHWDLDGETYEYSLPGGSFISFRELMEALGSADDVFSTADEEDNNGIDDFISDIQNIEFTDENLVKVIKVDQSQTAGQLADTYCIESEYSAEFTEDEITVMRSREFSAGDWVLVSLKPFESEEYLTVTLKTGEVFQILVTDAQLRKPVLTDSGETYDITVTYDDFAEIPAGADLRVEEILPGTERFETCLDDAATELGMESGEISFARFFDIKIVDENGFEVEPATPVIVQITYNDALPINQEEHLSIVHFANQGTEIIDNADLNEEGTTITYSQNGFSVTGTVVNGGPTNGQLYMLGVEYNNQKYIIQNDGTLINADDVENGRISVEYPMLWTYYYQYGAHFRFASEASGFNANQTASGYYYRYLDPNSPDGLTEENKSELYGPNNKNLEQQTRINYNQNKISAVSNNNMYIGISDEGGTLHIVGQQNSANAARVTLYRPDVVRPSEPLRNSVDHIDISIRGSAAVEASLAYGDYWYIDDDGNWQKIRLNKDNNKIDLIADNIKIDADDMKKAVIKTYKTKVVDGEEVPDLENELHNKYYITGYSANENTQWSTDQVRIEGSFKVADIPDVDNYWNLNSENTMRDRRDNKISYVVEATKNLDLDVEYEIGGKKYKLYQQKNDAECMTLNVDVPLTASFNYWTNKPGVGNECPPLQPEYYGFTNTWKRGGIFDWGFSGMDFVLHAGETEIEARILAIEIVKKVVKLKANGEYEEIEIPNSYTSTFEVYQDKPGNPRTVRENGSEVHDYGTYSQLHTVPVEVHNYTDGDGNIHKGTGLVYDYKVTDGMYYVKENRDFPTSFTIGGTTYNYLKTDIETEYSYRANQYRTRDEDGNTLHHERHQKTVSDGSTSLSSIPEVLGDYLDDNDEPETNEFLEFDFYNVYTENTVPTPIPTIESRKIGIELDKKWDNQGDTTPPSSGSVTFKLHQIKKRSGSSNVEDPAGSGYPKTLTVYAADDWKLMIPDLPVYVSDNTGVTTYEYWLEETGLSAEVADYRVPSFTNGFGSVNAPITGTDDGAVFNVEVTNKTGNVIKVQKRWIGIDPASAPPVTIRLWRMLVDENGNPKWQDSQQVGDPIVLTNDDIVQGTAWWEKTIPYPSDVPSQAGWKYAYYLTEDNLNRAGHNAYNNPKFYKIVGDEVISDDDAYNAISNPRDFGYKNYNELPDRDKQSTTTIEDTTLMVMNTPTETFDNIEWKKQWYVNNNGTITIVDNNHNNSNAVSDYAVGLQIYQKVAGTDGPLFPFTGPFYIAENESVIPGHVIYSEDNTFIASRMDGQGVWRYQFIKDPSKTSKGLPSGFPKGGYNSNGDWVDYEYVIKEIGVYTGNGATSADQLTRVLDFTNVGSWTFSGNQTSNRLGINYPAGKMTVTKKWNGTRPGSRVYFRIYRDNTDITDEIVNDPESYGLTVHDTYSDSEAPDHNSLIVRSDLITSGDEQTVQWQQLLIQGLQLKYFNGNTPGANCTYAIKEIGYSEADGTNHWDGDPIMIQLADGSMADSGEYYHVSEMLTGYVINDQGNASVVNDGRSSSVTPATTDNGKIEIQNKDVEPKFKNFEFTKIWQDQSGKYLKWPDEVKTITVDLYANGSKVVESVKLFVTPPDQQTTQSFTWSGKTYEWTVNYDQSGLVYGFKVFNLPAKYNNQDAVYSVVETDMSDEYEVNYGFIELVEKTEGDETVTETVFRPINNAESAADGQVIRNMKVVKGVELPHTGGPGTRSFYEIGGILILLAGLCLMKRRCNTV